jgi:hypothetical protein
MEYIFPDNKRFAFTIFDDTDNSTLENTKPVYDLLYDAGLRTTKSVWPLSPKKYNEFGNTKTLQDPEYLRFVLDLKQKGFEIALHNVGSGFYTRDEIITGIEEYKNKIGAYPKIHANHSRNGNNIYWGYKKFSFPFDMLYRLFNNKGSLGEIEGSPCFWGDIHKRHIKYTRSLHFNDINTLKRCPYMPYLEKKKLKYANFWFASTNAPELKIFNRMINRETIDRLEAEGGICIVYTHFANGFVDDKGGVDKTLQESIRRLSSKNGYFVPVSELLDFMLEQKFSENHILTRMQKFRLDLRFFYDKITCRL